MRAVDTNVVVRVLVRDDDRQVHQAEAFVAGGAWISHVVLAEAVGVLSANYGLGPSDVADMIEKLLNHQEFVVEDSGTIAAALTRFRTRPTLGFADCLILESARKAGHLPLGTFDREVGKVDGARRL